MTTLFIRSACDDVGIPRKPVQGKTTFMYSPNMLIECQAVRFSATQMRHLTTVDIARETRRVSNMITATIAKGLAMALPNLTAVECATAMLISTSARGSAFQVNTISTYSTWLH